jgi:hypothetical protein
MTEMTEMTEMTTFSAARSGQENTDYGFGVELNQTGPCAW